MTSPVSPIVQNLIVCEDIEVDPANPKRDKLVNVLRSIRSDDKPPYPHRHAKVCVLVLLTACRGQGEVRLEVREDETEDVIARTKTQTVSFPNSPLTVYRLRFRLRDCNFPAPGLYWIQFWYGDQMLDQEAITLY